MALVHTDDQAHESTLRLHPHTQPTKWVSELDDSDANKPVDMSEVGLFNAEKRPLGSK